MYSSWAACSPVLYTCLSVLSVVAFSAVQHVWDHAIDLAVLYEYMYDPHLEAHIPFLTAFGLRIDLKQT